MSNDISNVEPTEVNEYTAHTILNYCITHAVLKNKNQKFEVQIPYATLAKSCGVSEEKANKFFGAALYVTVSLTWGEHDSDDVELNYG